MLNRKDKERWNTTTLKYRKSGKRRIVREEGIGT